MLPVVLRLRIHVPDDRIDLRLAHTKSRIPFLPCKTAASYFIHPFRGDAFQRLDRFRQGHHGRQREQDMGVIRDAAEGENADGPVPSYFRHVSPKARLELLRDQVPAILVLKTTCKRLAV